MYVLHFATSTAVNGGQTFPVDTYTSSATSSTTGIVGIRILLHKLNFIWEHQGSSTADTTWDPTFVSWNIVQCRPDTQIRVDLMEPNANSVIIAADIYLVEENWKHTLFAFRNKGNLAKGFLVEIHYSYTVKLQQHTGGGVWVNSVTSTAALTPSTISFFLSLTFMIK